jgi:hypothetical protein
LQVWEVASKLWSAIRSHAGNSSRTGSVFEQAGSFVSASVALESAASRQQNGLVAYGPFYASLHFRHACHYALINRPTGSELLGIISEGFKVLDHLRDPLSEQIREEYPQLTEILRSSSHPVVIELKGIEQNRLSREDGRPDCSINIDLFLERRFASPEFQSPASFRIASVRADEIVAIYDLENWSYDREDGSTTVFHELLSQPDAVAMDRAKRYSPSDWLRRPDRP